MDKKELNFKLQDFKKSCYDKDYILGDLYFDEAYPGMIPTALIVKMRVKQSWMNTLSSRGKALDELIDVLWDTTTAETRKNVHVLAIFDESETELIQQPIHRQEAA